MTASHRFPIEHWTMEAVDGPIPDALRGRALEVRPPVTSYTALLDAGLVPDPLLGTNELDVTWVGEVTWRFTARFERPAALAGDGAWLVLGGVDTVATVTLNGQRLGRTETMHRPYRYDLAELGAALRDTGNELVVEIEPAARYAAAQRERLGALPFIEWPGAGHPYNFVRKMACNFGWDWGPALVTAGLWQPVWLQGPPVVESVRPRCFETDDPDEDALRVQIHVDLATGSGTRTVEATLTDEETGRRWTASMAAPPRAAEVVLSLTVFAPRRWWPVGHGDPALHELEVVVTTAETELDRWQGRVGLRTVELDRSADAAGTRCALRVNGRDIFCKGANWIPDDCFLERVDAGRYRARLEQAVAAHHNMVRVWGGGIFEQDAFYDACDALGLLVWQDFPFACALYPEEAPFDALVESEARHHIARLAHRASLVVWCGCNENLWAYEDWGWPPWKEQAAGRTWGDGFYRELLPRLVAELDPTRPYLPGSPCSVDGVHPQDDHHGTRHVWDAWNQLDYAVYRTTRPRFVAEFGYQGPATLATLREGLPDTELTPTAPALLHHQKALDGEQKLRARLAERFVVPDDVAFERWLYLTQLNQARAVTTGVEWWRSLWPHCAGALYWQLNDCWPAISWSAIDFGGRHKPLWYALRRSFAPQLTTVQPALDGDGLDACFVNDTDHIWSIAPHARRLGALDGAELAAADLGAHEVAPRSVLRLPLDDDLARPVTAADELIDLRWHPASHCAPFRALWFWDDAPRTPRPGVLHARVAELPEQRGYRLTLRAETLIRDLVVLADALDPEATVDDQLVTLLPGEQVELVVHTAGVSDPDALVSGLVLQHV